MYIRSTRTGSAASGDYFTYRLVRSQRVGKQVRQVTLLNLGRYFRISEQHWPALCSRIEELLGDQQPLFSTSCPVSVEREAQRIVAQLLARQAEITPLPPLEKDAVSDIQAVAVDSLEMSRPRTVGVEHAGLWAMEQVGFPEMLRGLGFNGPQRAAAIGSIIGRMAEPGSELATYAWLKDRSGLGELLDVDYESMSLMQLYRASDLLMKHRNVLEQHLFARVRDLFGLSCTITLYDLTNTYFEGEVRANAKAKRGHSKEKRTDCPLLTLGLVLDGSGFVRRSEVFAGNVSEAGTLEKMLKDLDAPAEALVVMDRGVASEANLVWLRERGYRYLVVSRQRARQFNSDEAICLKTASRDQVQVQKVISEDGKEVRLYCYSERRAKKEEGISKRFAERFEAGLKAIAEGLSRPRTMKDIDKIRERIGRLRQKSRGAGQHYRVEIIADETGKKAQAIHWEQQPREGTTQTHPGVYCLRSNQTDWDEEQMWRTYIMLTDLEAVFRSLKSELGLRPNYHHKEIRGDGHLFITVLAYQLVQIIRHRLRGADINDSWRTLRDMLSGQCRVTCTFRCADGRTLHVRKATLPEPGQRQIFQTLNTSMTPGGVKKIIV
jgi:transposase